MFEFHYHVANTDNHIIIFSVEYEQISRCNNYMSAMWTRLFCKIIQNIMG